MIRRHDRSTHGQLSFTGPTPRVPSLAAHDAPGRGSINAMATAAAVPHQPSRSGRVLVTAAGPRMRRVLDELSLPSFERYAARWGYAVQPTLLSQDGSGADAGAQAAKWQKIPLLREALANFSLAVWLDADVLILRDDEDLASHLHPDHFQALALEQVPAEHRINPNTGVWVMRSGPAAFEFLDAVEAAGPQPGPWADQGAVLAALGWDRGDATYRWARPGAGTDLLRLTSWLPPSWNQPYLGERVADDVFNSDAASYVGRPAVAAPHAVHFMGLTPEARYRHMAEALFSHQFPAVEAGL